VCSIWECCPRAREASTAPQGHWLPNLSKAMSHPDILRPPGHTNITYRSDALTFKTVKVPEKVRARHASHSL